MPDNSTSSILRNELLGCMLRNDLIIVTGTGVSLQSVGYPTQAGTEVAGWPGLLESGLKYCESHDLVSEKGAAIARMQIGASDTPEDLIDAAQKIHGWLDTQTNARLYWIKETIGNLKLHDPTLISAIHTLGGLITTLNYDNLFHEVTGLQPVHWKEQDKIDQHIRARSLDYILHIHGYWKALDSIVLDRTSYDEISKDNKMQQLMQSFARWHTMLFIGCGATFLDPNFRTLIKWCNTALSGANYRHYILCRQCDLPGYLRMLKPYGFLQPIVYGESFADLVPFINQLAIDSGKRASSANPPLSLAMPRSEPKSDGIQTPLDIWKLQTQQ